MQYGLVGAGYAAVLLAAAALLYARHLVALLDPAAASGGMVAVDELIAYFFIGCLFLVPTVFLIRILAKYEPSYSAYSRFLLGLSLSAPVCLGAVLFCENYVAPSLIWACVFRLLGSPIILVGMGISRLAARFDRAK